MTAAEFIDSHCHLDQYSDPMAVLRNAETRGVVTVAVTELPSRFQRLALRLGTRRLLRVALGVHPLRAAAASAMEMALFAELLDQTDYVGEIGLDGSKAGRPSLDGQLKVFEHLLQLPRIRRKVLTVHSRGAERETIDLLAQSRVTAILHWYSGAVRHIDTAAAAGLWFSVNPEMLDSANGRRIIAALPRERIVTETDGPYTKFAGRVAEPKDIPSVVTQLGSLWRESPEDAQRRVYDNMAAIVASSIPTAG